MMRVTAILALVLLCLGAITCHGNTKRMVCEQLDDIFGEDTLASPEKTMVQGIPGKKGIPRIKGSKGDRGLPGPPGVPDNREIDRLSQEISTLSNLIKRGLGNHSARIGKLERDWVPRSQLENCDVFHAGKCFGLIMTPSRMNVAEGKSACARIGGNPANIYSQEHFDKILALFRSRIYIGHNYNHIWTGMTIDTNRRKIRLSDRTWAPYTRWFPNRPFSSARGYVGIHVSSDPKSSGHGMFDEHNTYRLLGVLCEV